MSRNDSGRKPLNEGYKPNNTATGPKTPSAKPSSDTRGYQGGYQAPSTTGNPIPPQGGSGVVPPKK